MALRGPPRYGPEVRWYQDNALWGAVVVGLVLRVLPHALWPGDGCVRDECTYRGLAKRFAQGKGMTQSVEWIWAPGYPAYLGLNKALFGEAAVGAVWQVLATLVGIVFIYLLAQRTFSRRPGWPGNAAAGRRAGLWAAWLYATSAHMAWYAGRLWSEALYGVILLGGLLLFGAARDALSTHWKPEHTQLTRRAVGAAAGVGLVVGVCVLFRGVAQYMLPIFVAGLLWGRLRRLDAWKQAAALVFTAVVVVAPYSAYATQKFDSFMLSDKTMGRMMWLGNNNMDPVTFDYGNGSLSRVGYGRALKAGRKPCAKNRRDAIKMDACQTDEAVAWIKDNPEEFVRRMPLRVAQMLNPHSLLTRHLRWGNYKGMPQWMDELIVLYQVVGSMVAMLVGMAGLTTRGRGSQGLVIFSILLYHVAAISVLAGLSRYRVPLEPLLMVYAAGLLSDPKAAWREVQASAGLWRLWATLLVLAILIPLVLWFLPSGWPTWRTW